MDVSNRRQSMPKKVERGFRIISRIEEQNVGYKGVISFIATFKDVSYQTARIALDAVEDSFE
jgi:hypothetical protein